MQAWPEPSVVAAAGPDEPVIVAFGSLGGASGDTGNFISPTGGFYRLWSNGQIDVRLVVWNSTASAGPCESGLIDSASVCDQTGNLDTGWLTLPEPPGGDGFACRGDINGDRSVNAADLGLLIAQWGDGVSCDPQPTYPCFDLGNLSIAAAK